MWIDWCVIIIQLTWHFYGILCWNVPYAFCIYILALKPINLLLNFLKGRWEPPSGLRGPRSTALSAAAVLDHLRFWRLLWCTPKFIRYICCLLDFRSRSGATVYRIEVPVPAYGARWVFYRELAVFAKLGVKQMFLDLWTVIWNESRAALGFGPEISVHRFYAARANLRLRFCSVRVLPCRSYCRFPLVYRIFGKSVGEWLGCPQKSEDWLARTREDTVKTATTWISLVSASTIRDLGGRRGAGSG